ncbi:tRNA nucleotidyltransferase (CCA-adding enzyme) [Bacillus capparidis]|uniref:CCA-adding enzyme n=1 Tax=Bacillus capparidis TaxID=1840411 RepID=A0ABS4CSG8_9BACI|nr:tRNA nucleotidyltransferase (CCA-adding enzyme) [Bacillus capparidis]
MVLDEKFLNAVPLLEKLHTEGFQAYFVGGSVRDFLMNRPIGDIDIATDAKPEEIERHFKKTIHVGKEHGTIIVLHKGEPYEVTTFRTEEGYSDFRRPDKVSFIRSLKEDLQRRDLTINSMAMTKDGSIIDYFGGRNDIQKKRIHTVGNPSERFHEDALRMMRALRFVSQLGFHLSEETCAAIKREKELLSHISIERKAIEMEKMLFGPWCGQALLLMFSTGLSTMLPGFRACSSHQAEAISRFPFHHLKSKEELWAAILCLLEISPESSQAYLRQWKLSAKLFNDAAAIQKSQRASWDRFSLYKTGMHTALSAERIRMLLSDKQIDQERLLQLEEIYEHLPIKSVKELDIDGNELMQFRKKKPGKWIAEELEKIEKAVITDGLENGREAIKEWLKTCNQA